MIDCMSLVKEVMALVFISKLNLTKLPFKDKLIMIVYAGAHLSQEM